MMLVSGFLGSGKSSLLSHILSNAQGLKVRLLCSQTGLDSPQRTRLKRKTSLVTKLALLCWPCAYPSLPSFKL
jgi:G3E family GTPase